MDDSCVSTSCEAACVRAVDNGVEEMVSLVTGPLKVVWFVGVVAKPLAVVVGSVVEMGSEGVTTEEACGDPSTIP